MTLSANNVCTHMEGFIYISIIQCMRRSSFFYKCSLSHFPTFFVQINNTVYIKPKLYNNHGVIQSRKYLEQHAGEIPPQTSHMYFFAFSHATKCHSTKHLHANIHTSTASACMEMLTHLHGYTSYIRTYIHVLYNTSASLS